MGGKCKSNQWNTIEKKEVQVPVIQQSKCGKYNYKYIQVLEENIGEFHCNLRVREGFLIITKRRFLLMHTHTYTQRKGWEINYTKSF